MGINIIKTLRYIASPVNPTMLLKLQRPIQVAFAEAEAGLEAGAWTDGAKYRQGCELAAVMEKTFTPALPETVVNLLQILALTHDIGRLEQARLAQAEKSYDQVDHGRWSAELMAPVLAEPLGELWSPFAMAMAGHSLQSTPDLAFFNGSEVAYALCVTLRDYDKRIGFGKAATYCHDEAEKSKQAKDNGLASSDTCPTAEHEWILCEEGYDAVDAFVAGQTIDRSQCMSYEAYMLQLLGWLNDVHNPRIRKLIIIEGGPAIVLTYLKQQLGEESADYQKIAGFCKKQWDLVV